MKLMLRNSDKATLLVTQGKNITLTDFQIISDKYLYLHLIRIGLRIAA